MQREEVQRFVLSASNPVMEITGLRKDMWYRKPSGPRRTPWYSADYDITDEALWRKKEGCIYFVRYTSKYTSLCRLVRQSSC